MNFKKKIANIVMAIPIKQAKQNAARDKKQNVVDDNIAEIVEKVDEKVHRPGIRTKRWESEAPSTEIKC